MKYLIVILLFFAQQAFGVGRVQSDQFELNNKVVINENEEYELHVSLTNLSGETLTLDSAFLPWVSNRVVKKIILNGSLIERLFPIGNYSHDRIELQNDETIKEVIPFSELIIFEDIPKKINMELFWSYELEDVDGVNYGYKSGRINYPKK